MPDTAYREPSGRPISGEYAAYAQPDIDLVVGDDACEVLLRQQGATVSLFRAFGDSGGDLSYGEGRWSIKQVLGHLADDERIFAYRALCVARGDSRELPGFDEKRYVTGAGFASLSMEDLLADYVAVRGASVSLFRNMRALPATSFTTIESSPNAICQLQGSSRGGLPRNILVAPTSPRPWN